MSILSKLFGKKVEKVAEDLMKEAFRGSSTGSSSKPAPTATASNSYSVPSAPVEEEPSGDSWGPRMPAEENQFSYSGNYISYFEHVYKEAFPQYQLDIQRVPNRNAYTIEFRLDGRRALVVELMSDRSVAQRIRKACAQESIPYLRFYHDHPNWWNTRSYVVRRTREALGL